MAATPKVIALYGFPGSGKDTAAHFLEKKGFKHLKVATPLKAAVCALFGWREEIFEDRVLKELTDPVWGISPRQAAQYVGYDLVKGLNEKFPVFAEMTGMNLYGENLKRSVRNHVEKKGFFRKKVVVSDMRFPSEFQALKDLEAAGEIELQLIRINRKGTGPSNSHASESHYSDFVADGVINNEGSMRDLYDKVRILLKAK